MEAVMPWLNEFEKGLMYELDFRREVRNIAMFREMYRDRTDIRFPRPYSKLSTEDVIVMDYTPSVPITKPFKADRLINMFLEQLLYEGVIHGDLHTGNIGLDAMTDALVMYDFGNIIRITDMYKRAMRDLVYGVQTSNVDAIVENMVLMGITIRTARRPRTLSASTLNTWKLWTFDRSRSTLQNFAKRRRGSRSSSTRRR
jgi:ubiquinone biosynthesis protein